MAFRDDFNLVDFAAYAVAVGLSLPALAVLRPVQEIAALAVCAVVLVPFPFYLARLRYELPDWCDKCLSWHLRATWALAILAAAMAAAWRLVWQD